MACLCVCTSIIFSVWVSPPICNIPSYSSTLCPLQRSKPKRPVPGSEQRGSHSTPSFMKVRTSMRPPRPLVLAWESHSYTGHRGVIMQILEVLFLNACRKNRSELKSVQTCKCIRCMMFSSWWRPQCPLPSPQNTNMHTCACACMHTTHSILHSIPEE